MRPDRFWARFWGKVDKQPNGCWVWTGCIIRNGYGQCRQAYVHRMAWEQIRGPIPPGLQLDHLCRNRACCNPDHLEPVTNRENVVRGFGPTAINARKTECKRGHAYTEENTYHYRDGRRDCRVCMKMRREKSVA